MLASLKLRLLKMLMWILVRAYGWNPSGTRDGQARNIQIQLLLARAGIRFDLIHGVLGHDGFYPCGGHREPTEIKTGIVGARDGGGFNVDADSEVIMHRLATSSMTFGPVRVADGIETVIGVYYAPPGSEIHAQYLKPALESLLRNHRGKKIKIPYSFVKQYATRLT